MLVYSLAHPAILVASHSVVLANFSKLVAIVYKNKLVCHTHNFASVIAIAVYPVANIVPYFVFYHLLCSFSVCKHYSIGFTKCQPLTPYSLHRRPACPVLCSICCRRLIVCVPLPQSLCLCTVSSFPRKRRRRLLCNKH